MTVPEHAQKDNTMAVEIKVLTINVWGIPGISKNREARMEAIANQLVTGPDEFDFVFLQEIWSKADYCFLASKVNKVLPFAHYFFSGVIGSGMCIFSRSPITEVYFHKFTLNGFPHKINHGDWWGGKGVALCKSTRYGIPFILANTHLHAEYNRKNDEYVHHRAVQAFETSQLIRLFQKAKAVLIFAGDFNCTPTDFAYRIVKFYGNLVDTYTDSPTKVPGSNGESNETPANSYTNVKALIDNPSGNRIDYVFYQASKTHKVKTKVCDQPWPQRVPQQDFSFSDHEAVRSILTITPIKEDETTESITEVQAQTDALLESSAVCEQGLKKVAISRRFYITLAILVTVLQLGYLVVLSLETSPGLRISLGILSMILMIFLVYFLFMGTVFYHIEYNGVKSTRQAIKCHLEMLTVKNAQIFEEERKRSVSFIK
ncbi:putative neutral sphingomyelinase isoform X2 [Procambarus clarkii]|uniref:putative neutral sphingomyelinase isoform X2 n=1 Tax=Procambarus clarkii TaxID=6728 RepID=UPI001E674EEE|nr:putative neutral sphingomyelinase [Procambarus clarkii]XP_045618332.1 putative neutral sphingomyelinase [Procambarus clarkii]XP_045618333.1 putative neutral sphingomyelinase [Procambarus clarkii]XP_045618335.1 putative neutral sphingomyelinase [Procambarus clarkii]